MLAGRSPYEGDVEELDRAVHRLAHAISGAVVVCDGVRHVSHAVHDRCRPGAALTDLVLRRRTVTVPDRATWHALPHSRWEQTELDVGSVLRRPDEDGVRVLLFNHNSDFPSDLPRGLDDVLAALRGHRLASSAAATLLGLVDGEVGPEGLVPLDFPVGGARLVAVRPVRPAGLVDDLSRRRDIVAAVHRTGHVAALVRDVPRGVADDRALRQAIRLCVEVARSPAGGPAGISTRIDDVASLPAAWRDALDAADLAADTGQRWLSADDVWAILTLRRLRTAVSTALPAAQPLHRLASYDTSKGTDLARTVLIWLDSNQDTARAAQRLSLHPNTLRYRLRRAEEVGGLDLDDASQRLVAHLALAEVAAAWRPSTGKSSR
jgi:hypothetical protein